MVKFGCGALMLAFGAILALWLGYNLFISPQKEFVVSLGGLLFLSGLFFVGSQWVRQGWPAMEEILHPRPRKKKKRGADEEEEDVEPLPRSRPAERRGKSRAEEEEVEDRLQTGPPERRRRPAADEIDVEDRPRARSIKRRGKTQAWPGGLIVGLAAGGGVLAIVVVVLAALLFSRARVPVRRTVRIDRNAPINPQPANPNAVGNPPRQVQPPLPAPPPDNRPPKAHQIVYTVRGERSPVDDLPRIKQALSAVPGVDPASIEATADSIRFRIDHEHNNLLPVLNAVTKLGYRVVKTSTSAVR